MHERFIIVCQQYSSQDFHMSRGIQDGGGGKEMNVCGKGEEGGKKKK